MTAPQLEVQLIAAVVAAACAIPGAFLVLRRMAMLSDAISHAILPGIVVAFLLTGNLASPLLVVAAAATGVLTAFLVELVNRSGLVREDAAIGLVFPVLFSAGVILIARRAGDVHLDVDAVLLGELAFAPFNRFTLGGADLGPQALWVMGVILALNVGGVLLFYKELKLATFDAALAGTLGFSPALVHYGLMASVSTTAVGAFDAVGSVLVVALMIAPPAAAYLLTDRLGVLLPLGAGIGAASAVAGYWAAHLLDASIAGCMAAAAGFAFLLAFLLAPERGTLAQVIRRARQRREFAVTMLTIHLLQHEGLPEAEQENRVEHLHEHLRWSPEFARAIARDAERTGLVTRDDATLSPTATGRQRARDAMNRL